MPAKPPLESEANGAFVYVFLISYATLLVSVDRRTERAPAAVESALATRPFASCANPFGLSSTKARSDVQNGKITTPDGTQHELNAKEKDVALVASQNFGINEVDASILLRSQRIDQGRKPDEVAPDEEAGSEMFWDSFFVFWLNERLQAINLVTQLLTMGDGMDEETTAQSNLAGLVVARAQKLEKHYLALNCINGFTARAKESVPISVRDSERRAAFYSRQLLREQLALLTQALLCCNHVTTDVSITRAALGAAEDTNWGRIQANEAYFDSDAVNDCTQVQNLLILLSISILNLEVAALDPSIADIPSILDKDATLHPDSLIVVHKEIMRLVAADAIKAAPLLLGWSLVLHRLRQALQNSSSEGPYRSFASEVPEDFHERAISHALDSRCGLFVTLGHIISSNLTRSSYAVAYLDVLRGLLVAIPQVLYVSVLADDQYSAFLATYIALYSSPHAGPLRQRLWEGEDVLCLAEKSFISQVEQRFPAQTIDTVRLLSALASPGLYDHFATLQTLTSVVPKATLFSSANDGTVTSQAIVVSQNVVVPMNTPGRTLSAPGTAPHIVCWDMTAAPWSGWELLSDALAEIAGVNATSLEHRTDDVFGFGPPARLWSNNDERNEVARVALELFAAALDYEDIQLFGDLLDVHVLFRLLDVNAAKALKIIVKMLPLTANAIWITLQGMQFFPRRTSTFLLADKAHGTYASTRALAELSYYLFLEDRNGVGGELSQVKRGVLEAALSWIRDEVWSPHRGWRYAERRERYELSEYLCGMMIEIVEDNSATSKEFARSMLDNGLRLAPLLGSISSGASAVHVLAAEGRIQEADVVRRAVASNLQLTVSLLSIRRHVVGPDPSLLERSLLTLDQIDHVSALMRYVNISFAEHSPDVAREASRVLAALTALTPDWSTPIPSLLAHLDENAAEAFVEMLALDRFDRHLQIALWSFASAIVECQPGLAMLLVSGAPIRGGPEKQTERRITAVAVAIDLLQEAHHDVELRAALLRFLDMTWQRIADYAVVLGDLRASEKLWASTVDLVFASPTSSAVDVLDVAHSCYSALARASACNILASDIRFACLTQPKMTMGTASVKGFLTAVKASDRFISAAIGFLHSACDPASLQNLHDQLNADFPAFSLEAHRRPLTNVSQLDTARRFGESYLYPTDITLAALEAMDPDKALEAVQRVEEIDDSHALMDAQMMSLMAWRRLLEEAKPIMKVTPDCTAILYKAASAVALQASEEAQGGDLISMIHAERLGTHFALIDALPEADSDVAGLVQSVLNLRQLYDLDLLSPVDPLRDQQQAAYHRPLFGSTFLLFQRLQSATISDDHKAIVLHALDDILQSAIVSLQAVLSLRLDEKDLSLVASVISSTIVLKDAPLPVTWLVYLIENGVLPLLFDFIGSMRPGSQRALALAISLGSFPAGAERMATEGCIQILTTSQLLLVVNDGRLASDDERHPLWVLSLTLAVVLASSLGNRPLFMEQIGAFARQVAPQLARALSWQANRPLSIALIDEAEATVSLLRCLAGRTISHDSMTSFVSLFIPVVMSYMEEVTAALQHLNTLIASFETTSLKDRAWLEMEQETRPLRERAVAGPLTQTLLGILCQLLDMLVAWAQAFRPLTRDIIDWPFDRLLKRENTPAADLPCVGGLFELAGYAVDLLNEIGGPSATLVEASAPHPPLPLLPFDATTTRSRAVRALESALVLSTSQCCLVAGTQKVDLREEVVDELLDWLRKGAGAVKDVGGQSNLLDQIGDFASRSLVVMRN